MSEQERILIHDEGSDMQTMLMVRRPAIALFVDRTSQQWIARDVDGQFWSIPPVDHPWNHRQPFQPTDETQLEPVPGHYKSMLGVPL
jgi:hypothetical protein